MAFNLRSLLQDEEFLFGAGLLTQGSQGQNIGQAAFPALIDAGKTASLFKKKDAFSKLLESDKVSDIDKLYLAAGITPPRKGKTSKPTISDEVLAVYSKLKVANNDKEFKQIFDGLSKPEQALYNNKILGNVEVIEQAVADKIKNMVTLDVAQLGVVSEYKLTKKVEGFESVAAIVEASMAQNKDASFEQVLESLIQAGLIEK